MFETIYDVPLDGTYVFQVYDSGERGLGRMTAIKVSERKRKECIEYFFNALFKT